MVKKNYQTFFGCLFWNQTTKVHTGSCQGKCFATLFFINIAIRKVSITFAELMFVVTRPKNPETPGLLRCPSPLFIEGQDYWLEARPGLLATRQARKRCPGQEAPPAPAVGGAPSYSRHQDTTGWRWRWRAAQSRKSVPPVTSQSMTPRASLLGEGGSTRDASSAPPAGVTHVTLSNFPMFNAARSWTRAQQEPIRKGSTAR